MTLFPPPAGGPVIPAGLAVHGNQLTADLNQLITQPISFLATGVFARMRQTTPAQSLTSGAENVLAYDTVDEDPYAGWNAASNWWMPPAGCSGWYLVVVACSAASPPSDAILRPVILLNGTPQYALEGPGAPGSSPLSASGSALIYMLGGSDYVQGGAFWQSGSGAISTSIAAGDQPLLQVSWESN